MKIGSICEYKNEKWIYIGDNKFLFLNLYKVSYKCDTAEDAINEFKEKFNLCDSMITIPKISELADISYEIIDMNYPYFWLAYNSDDKLVGYDTKSTNTNDYSSASYHYMRPLLRLDNIYDAKVILEYFDNAELSVGDVVSMDYKNTINITLCDIRNKIYTFMTDILDVVNVKDINTIREKTKMIRNATLPTISMMTGDMALEFMKNINNRKACYNGIPTDYWLGSSRNGSLFIVDSDGNVTDIASYVNDFGDIDSHITAGVRLCVQMNRCTVKDMLHYKLSPHIETPQSTVVYNDYEGKTIKLGDIEYIIINTYPVSETCEIMPKIHTKDIVSNYTANEFTSVTNCGMLAYNVLNAWYDKYIEPYLTKTPNYEMRRVKELGSILLPVRIYIPTLDKLIRKNYIKRNILSVFSYKDDNGNNVKFVTESEYGLPKYCPCTKYGTNHKHYAAYMNCSHIRPCIIISMEDVIKNIIDDK